MRRINITSENIESIELRSEEVREIMGHTPSRIIRYGNILFFLILVIIIIGSLLIELPEILNANFSTKSLNLSLNNQSVIESKNYKNNCYIIAPFKGSGKIQISQKINIKLDNYPYQEFGIVKTELIEKVGTCDSAVVYLAILPDTLLTNYGYSIPFSNNLRGQADIITEKSRVLFRIVTPLKRFLKKYND